VDYEEFWHGDAIGKVLAAHDESAGTGRIAALRQRLPKGDRWKPLGFQVASALTPAPDRRPHDVGCGQRVDHAGAYARLAKLSDHPTLATLLLRIMKQEGRHIDFYATQAAERLESSKRAQRITRWALRGSGLRSAAASSPTPRWTSSAPTCS